ncbi:MAG TPA: hypothetical protein VKB41_04150 [Steroidobacteraceae bacterium]|nr:hypothetical protein [Steroidobacteraceae bacterium]
MALTSKLFRGDAALDACLTKDSAHVLQGARGPHVEKIHRALATLDGAIIAPAETAKATYGKTTAAAVLAYKTQRGIINRSYQQTADNIVGKMTIASLDKEMLEEERRPTMNCCTDPARGGKGGKSQLPVTEAAVREATPGRPAILSALVQLVRVKDKLGPHAFTLANETAPRANQLLQPFGMRVARIVGFSVDFPFKVKYGETSDFVGLRKAAEKAMPGFKPALRVLICPFRSNERGDDDLTNNAVSIDEPGFDRFVVFNANTLRADRGTLLHEMIHCSSPLLMSDAAHDPDQSDSIFSWNSNRTRLRPEHARALQGAPFAG